MNQEEKIVKKYLELNINDRIIVNDNTVENPTPDLSVGDLIGVEVRRLNQIYINDDGTYEGLENKSFPLSMKFKKEVKKIPKRGDECWYVHLHFRRPYGNLSKVWNKINSELVKFRNGDTRSDRVIKISNNVSIGLNKSGIFHGEFYQLGEFDDKDWGMFYSSEIMKSLEIIVKEKENQVKPHFHKYENWWLVLVDYIFGNLYFDEYDKIQLNTLKGISEVFEKIIIIDSTLEKSPYVIESFKY